MLRQQWRDFVVDPSRVGRHLSNIGTSVKADQALPINEPLLGDFLSRLAKGSTDVAFLADVVDLLASGYDNFCIRELPLLLDSLSNEQVGRDAVVGPALRGNIRWDRTYVGRQSGRISPVQFVTRLPTRTFELPENELVKWLVDNLERAVATVESRVGSKGLPAQLQSIRAACHAANDHRWFNEVRSPHSVDVQMSKAAQRQRLPAYRHAAKFAERRGRYLSRDKVARWQNVMELLAANWLAPVSDDDLFELYALTIVLDFLENGAGLGPPVEIGLMMSGRSYVAFFKRDASLVKVYFDQSPTGFLKCSSQQVDILNAHEGVRPVPRRPDIVIVHEREDVRRVIFLEVKRSSDSGYLSDSIYKALGYISDFGSLWKSDESKPKVIVLVPENVALKSDRNPADLDVVLISSLDRVALKNSLAVALKI